MGRTTRQLVVAGTAIAAVLLLAGVIDVALAQGTPFGVGAPKSATAGNAVHRYCRLDHGQAG